MGIYLVSVGASEWFGPAAEDGMGEVAAALDAELVRRGAAPYASVPEEPEEFVRGAGQSFEEKLIPAMDGFTALCRRHLTPAEFEMFGGWSVLVPLSLPDTVELPVPSSYEDRTVIAGAPQVLALAQRLATAIELPAEVPATSDNLDLTLWLAEGSARELARLRPGPWTEDLDAAFYVALFLRAAEHSLRRGCPLTFC
ncbi:hypothetical protein ACFW1A_31815 [Kitasatospora sp. NPDC058965]|uniref:hypothetical protein n=1 Tax=Kitasatospora sp. NPDC058965 TaxID=3346682 RepID=UPI0036D1923F